jgi:hypothetical protein
VFHKKAQRSEGSNYFTELTMNTVLKKLSARTKTLLITATIAGANPALADSIKVTVEESGISNSTATFANGGLETFDAVSGEWFEGGTTLTSNFPPSSGLSATIQNIGVRDIDNFGGAGASGRYAITPGAGANFSTTITLNQSVNYFGLWISAMNDSNTVLLYRDSNLLYQFDMTALSNIIGNCSSNPRSLYCGNPRDLSLADNELFAFVNFFNENGEGFNIIVISGAGFESDNWTIGNFLLVSGNSVVTAADTLNSFRPNAIALRNAFNLQSAKMAQGLSYDCSVFDTKNLCVSFAGTRSDGKGGLDDTRGALIVAHKPNANVRFGGYIDQSFNSSESGGLKVKHSSPGYGVFAVWSEKADGSGLQVRGSASFGKADMESTRSDIGNSEAGFGKSDIKSDGFQIEASRDYAVNAMWSARPYVGFRQLTNRRASYTETDSVVFPLSYSSIKQSTQSLLAGVRFAHTISAQTTMTVAAGLEHDIKNDVDRYEATGVDDLGSIDMEDGKKNTRPTLSLGLTHVIDKAQRIGVSITHRKEAFESGYTTSGMVQYSRGF